MPSILNHFDALTDKGLKVIPLRENSKAPLCKGWTIGWDREKTREKLKQFPESNIGLLLGEIVDVEGDSLKANRTILNLIGDYPHPAYQSLKSIHHLFLTPDLNLRHFRMGQIEFRGFGHQSVLPPSQHSGIAYKWLRAFQFPIPAMPERLLDYYLSNKDRQFTKIKPGHLKVPCCSCGAECFPHKKRFELETEAFRLLGQKWECLKCRVVDLRPTCRLLRSGVVPKSSS
jgi:hypothetical protein